MDHEILDFLYLKNLKILSSVSSPLPRNNETTSGDNCNLLANSLTRSLLYSFSFQRVFGCNTKSPLNLFIIQDRLRGDNIMQTTMKYLYTKMLMIFNFGNTDLYVQTHFVRYLVP